MMVLRNATAWMAAVSLVSVLGCATSRSNTTPAPAMARSNQTAPSANRQVGTGQLMHIGDTLRSQGKFERAADVYRWILQREPNNLAARERLAMVQRAGTVPIGPRKPPRADRQASRPSAPPRPVSPRHPLPPPPAPGVIEDVPQFPGPPPIRKSVPSPGTFDSAMKRYRASSELPTTVVSGAGAFEDVNMHTIQIIPASKGGLPKVQELRVSDGDQDPYRAPVRKAAPTPAAGDASQVQPSAGVGKPPLPAGLRELRAYVDAPGRHVTEITARLHDGSPAVRSLAAFLLGRAGEPARSSAPILDEMLASEPNGPTRIRAAEALVRIFPRHEAALGVLLAGLSSPDRAVRWEAVVVSNVVKTVPHRSAVLKKVIDRLQDVESRIRVMAALKLGEARSDKSVAVAELEKVLHDPDSTDEIRKAASISLAALRWVRRREASTRSAAPKVTPVVAIRPKPRS
jgi:HEAT repeats